MTARRKPFMCKYCRRNFSDFEIFRKHTLRHRISYDLLFDLALRSTLHGSTAGVRTFNINRIYHIEGVMENSVDNADTIVPHYLEKKENSVDNADTIVPHYLEKSCLSTDRNGNGKKIMVFIPSLPLLQREDTDTSQLNPNSLLDPPFLCRQTSRTQTGDDFNDSEFPPVLHRQDTCATLEKSEKDNYSEPPELPRFAVNSSKLSKMSSPWNTVSSNNPLALSKKGNESVINGKDCEDEPDETLSVKQNILSGSKRIDGKDATKSIITGTHSIGISISCSPNANSQQALFDCNNNQDYREIVPQPFKGFSLNEEEYYCDKHRKSCYSQSIVEHQNQNQEEPIVETNIPVSASAMRPSETSVPSTNDWQSWDKNSRANMAETKSGYRGSHRTKSKSGTKAFNPKHLVQPIGTDNRRKKNGRLFDDDKIRATKVLKKATVSSFNKSALSNNVYTKPGPKTTTLKRRSRKDADVNESFPCKVCPKVFRKPRFLLNHMICHSEEKNHSCRYCSKRFARKHHLNNHERTHTQERPVQCPQCQKRFTQQSYLKVHLLVHSGEKPHPCELCDKWFKQKSHVNRHMMQRHSSLRPYKCPQCGSNFKTPEGLKVHERSHSEVRPFKCNQCPMDFTSRAYLKIHQRSHNGDRPYICKECGQAFTQGSHLTSHMSVHSDARPFQCDTCEKCFKLKSSLVSHWRVHSDERPYKCKKCPKAFKNPNGLQAHDRLHLGIRPYSCQYCGQRFNYGSHCKTHERIHTGEKPFQCPMCKESFARRRGLHNHTAKLHMDKDGNMINLSA